MADNRKYYWLKLKEDFFEDKIIKYLRKLPDGNAIVIVFLKMQLKSLKTEGFIKYDGILPTCEDELALILDEDATLVRYTIAALEKVGAVEKWDNETLYISALQPLIGTETAAAERVRRHREKKKKMSAAEQLSEPEIATVEGETAPEEVLQCNTEVTSCNTEIEIEKEIELDIEIELEKDKDKEIELEKDFNHQSNKHSVLSEKEQERVTFLIDLFDGWRINEHQINHIANLVSAKFARVPMSTIGLDLKIYDYIYELVLRARSYSVQHIYGWMLKVIPETAPEDLL